MLCSERELMLSDNHDGIIELPADAPLGVRYIDYRGVNDPVIEIKVTPNRPDALGIHGIARDLAARGMGTLKPRRRHPGRGHLPHPDRRRPSTPALKAKGCPHFAGRLIRGVKNGPSPDWMQARLKAIGLRPISALVDITNYFTFGLNRPLHVFDAAKVKGDLRIRPAREGETLLALDGKTYTLTPGQMVIADDHGPESLAGIMGGEASGCTPETTDVFLESAYWDPITIAATGRALKINSDARYRFERGVDPAFTLPGLELATQMILDLCGGEAGTGRAGRRAPRHHPHLPAEPRPGDQPRRHGHPRSHPARHAGSAWLHAGRQRGDPAHLAPRHPGRRRPDRRGRPHRQPDQAARRADGPAACPACPRPILTPLQVRERTARRTIAALGLQRMPSPTASSTPRPPPCSAAAPMPCASKTRSRPR